jgi:FkbM family methyltransferase
LAAKVISVEPQQSCTAILRCAYGKDPKVSVVSAACGAAPGSAVMRVAEDDSLSSLSDDWISAMRSGRFSYDLWTKQEPCVLVTLDDLIHSYGEPAFIKIDVEGYELNVLRGLTRRVRCVSFEFHPERFDRAMECADYLCALGLSRFNVSLGETLRMLVESWIGRNDLPVLLKESCVDADVYGEIYATI